MKAVEDQLSGIPENPNAVDAPPDGRMYPPHDRFRKGSAITGVSSFLQRAHATHIGINGAVSIVRRDGTIDLEMAGADGRTIDDLLGDDSGADHGDHL